VRILTILDDMHDRLWVSVAKMERDSLLRQADHMWKVLDNMAENNPEGYQRFIKKQLQEGSAHFKPPEPVFCLSCEIDKVRIFKL